jgi:uncharacterized RDD family membrane protein YckC
MLFYTKTNPDEPEITEPINPNDYPPLIKRFQSLITDQVFLIICMVIISQLMDNTDEESTGAFRGIMLFGLFAVYEPFCMSFGCTLGNRISGIRVRKFKEQDKRIGLFNSYLRFITKMMLGIISFFTVGSNPWKRAIHDKVSGSIMLNTKKKGLS